MKIFLLLFLQLSLFASPDWYEKIPKPNDKTYIGYGSAKTEAEAKNIALKEISNKISTTIDDSTKASKKLVDGEYSTSFETTTKQKSKAKLSDYEVIDKDYERSSKLYYVAIAYENIPSFDKFVKKLKKYSSDKDEKQNKFIKNTIIAKRLNKELGRTVNFSLLRKNENWFLKYKETLQLIDTKDFSGFFTTQDNEKVIVNTNKRDNILRDYDSFYFKVKTQDKGYVTILTVYEDGTVTTLVRNEKITKNKLQNIPNKEYASIPVAGLLEAGKKTYDLYVVLNSKKRLHFDQFAYADDNVENEEKYKNFDELIEFLDDKEFATLKVTTIPR